MRILLTGATSFTGYWFAHTLAAAGHELVMPLRRDTQSYEGVRAQRLAGLEACGTIVPRCVFGDDRFIELIQQADRWDVLCHHAAEARDYKNPAFDVCAAIANNTHRLRETLDALKERECGRVVLTGSVFEPGEGAGSEGLPAFSPYGLSKAMTAEMFAFYTGQAGMHLGKFVIANPFGPLEEPRFTQYLVRSWYQGETPSVKTPAYVRDNIHVSLLAAAYGDFVGSRPIDGGGRSHLNPSGYIESQGTFARRFAAAMQPRLGITCDVTLEEQVDFSEPRVRINTDPVDAARLGWDEAAAWDALAAYYQDVYAGAKGVGSA